MSKVHVPGRSWFSCRSEFGPKPARHRLILCLQKSTKKVKKLSKLYKSERALLELDFGDNICHALWARTLLECLFQRLRTPLADLVESVRESLTDRLAESLTDPLLD